MKTNTEHLDFYVSQALDNFDKQPYPQMDIPKSDRNVFIGSGSAFCVAQLFAKKFNGLALNASDYKDFIKRAIDRNLITVYIISASGGKDSIPMAEFLMENGHKPTLITCNPDAPAKNQVAKIWVFPAFEEPPTYNVSTYGSMIYWLFKEDTGKIKEFIKKLADLNLRKYHYVFFMAQDQYAPIAEMASRKVAETLEGLASNSSGFTHGSHGMLRQPDKKRLIVALNLDYPFQENIYNIKIDSYLGLLMSAYYLIGKNQTEKDTQNLLKNYGDTVKAMGWKLNKIF